jgi:acyl-coenzyme A synthetase/AMP-(fatty) acid ligase
VPGSSNVDLGHPDPDTIFGIRASHRVTSFCAPPTLYRRLVQADCSKYDLSALRHCTSAGEPLNPEVIRAWKNGTGGLEIYDGYGQTETTCTPSVCSPATNEDPVATADAFRGPFYFTGDRAAQDEDGYFWLWTRYQNHQRQDPPVRAA